MALTLPVAVDKKLVGTCFVGGSTEGFVLFITTLHHLGNGASIQIALPPNLGNISKPQTYPLKSVSTIDVEMVYSNPILDLAVLKAGTKALQAPTPNFLQKYNEVKVGEDVMIVGYPYSTMNSFLETAEKCSISAIGNRVFMDTIEVKEFIVSHQTFQGSSGSPIIRRSSGEVCGIVRGCLAPPEVISIGDIPLGTDSNITYALNASIIPNILKEL